MVRLNIQESRMNNANEQNNVHICFIFEKCVVKSKLFKNGCDVTRSFKNFFEKQNVLEKISSDLAKLACPLKYHARGWD